jgi:hypothetical protein
MTPGIRATSCNDRDASGSTSAISASAGCAASNLT